MNHLVAVPRHHRVILTLAAADPHNFPSAHVLPPRTLRFHRDRDRPTRIDLPVRLQAEEVVEQIARPAISLWSSEIRELQNDALMRVGEVDAGKVGGSFQPVSQRVGVDAQMPGRGLGVTVDGQPDSDGFGQ